MCISLFVLEASYDKISKERTETMFRNSKVSAGDQREPVTQACRITVLDELGGKPASRDPSIPWKIGW